MTSADEKSSPTDTRKAIMEATFRALSKHGYADLRMRHIGEEFEMTHQLIHYYYDGKNDLISAFLEYVIEQYEGSVEVDESDDVWEELDARIDQCLFGPKFAGDFDHWDRMKVYHELFSQAQNDGDHREIFNEHYIKIRGSITQVIERGIEQGAFREVDAENTAQFITDAIHAARGRRISLGHDEAPEEVRRALDEFVVSSLAPIDATPRFKKSSTTR